MSRVLITGAAGFIGAAAAERWLEAGAEVIGLDAITDYYDPALKQARLDRLRGRAGFTFVKGRIETPELLADLFATHRPDIVLHLAAQAGVRYSIENPRSYLEANLCGSFELLEAARAHPPAHMLLASTSSAYGANTEMPYAETQRADHQMSFYAATKKGMEAMAHSYAHLFGLKMTVFRFFTVYGPWGRPDMAPMKFAARMLAGDPIDVYNHGRMKRDFTFIDDLVTAILRLAEVPPGPAPVAEFDSLSPVAPYRVVNIGKAEPDELEAFIAALETAFGVTAKRRLMEMQPGDVPATWADTRLLETLTGYRPKTPLAEGIDAFAAWYRDAGPGAGGQYS